MAIVESSSSSHHHSTEMKVKEIEQILENPEGIDLWKLREACLSEGGLVHGELIRPLLVGLYCLDATIASKDTMKNLFMVLSLTVA